MEKIYLLDCVTFDPIRAVVFWEVLNVIKYNIYYYDLRLRFERPLLRALS